MQNKIWNEFLLKWFDINFLYVKWTPLSVANWSHTTILAQESNKHDDITKNKWRQMKARQMSIQRNKGKSSLQMVITKRFDSATCYLTVGHLRDGKSPLLQPPKTHKLGMVANFAYFSRQLAWYALQKLLPVTSLYHVTSGIPTMKIILADDKNHQVLRSITK